MESNAVKLTPYVNFGAQVEFKSIITNVRQGCWRVSFNNRVMEVRRLQEGVYARDLDTDEVIDGDELRSIKNFLDWHVKSQRSISEVARLWTTR